MRTTSQNTQTTKTVSQADSRYGSPEPQIELRLPKGTSHRLVSAGHARSGGRRHLTVSFGTRLAG